MKKTPKLIVALPPPLEVTPQLAGALMRRFGPVLESIKIEIPQFSSKFDPPLIFNLIQKIRQQYLENQADGVVTFGPQEFLLGVARNDVPIFVPDLALVAGRVLNVENTFVYQGNRYVIKRLLHKSFKLALHKPQKPKAKERAFIIRISSKTENALEAQLAELYPSNAISTIDPAEFSIETFTQLISRNPPREIVLSDVWELVWYLKHNDIKPLWEDGVNTRLLRVMNVVELTEEV